MRDKKNIEAYDEFGPNTQVMDKIKYVNYLFPQMNIIIQ